MVMALSKQFICVKCDPHCISSKEYFHRLTSGVLTWGPQALPEEFIN